MYRGILRHFAAVGAAVSTVAVHHASSWFARLLELDLRHGEAPTGIVRFVMLSRCCLKKICILPLATRISLRQPFVEVVHIGLPLLPPSAAWGLPPLEVHEHGWRTG